MTIAGVVLLIIVLIFGGVILFGAPYLPTTRRSRKDALDLLDLKPGQVFVDLGSGDGTMLVAAAKRGLRAVGYEINPFLAIVSRLRTLRYGKKVKIHIQNFWRADLSGADGVFVFLITHHMEHLDNFIKSQKHIKTLKVASHAFEIPGKKFAKKQGAIFLYEYDN